MSMTYKKRMQRKKEYIDSRIDEANIDTGIIVLLTGNGKGKSSSAMAVSYTHLTLPTTPYV